MYMISFCFGCVLVWFAMKDFPLNDGACHDRCEKDFTHSHSHGMSTGSMCYCIVCTAALSTPEFYKSAGCVSYRRSLKVGRDKMLEKWYAESYGRYYYC